jgi:hypothetical protein
VPTPIRCGTVVAALLLASPAFASQLSLTIRDGKVTLLAQDVSVQEVLDEWARVGRVTIVNGERLTSPPLTLQLDNVPEGEALAAVLRSASGYVLAPRAQPDASASRFDRVLILPVSVPPPAVNSVPPVARPATRLPAFPRPLQAQPQDDAVAGTEAEGEAPPETPEGPIGPPPGEVPAQVAPPGTAGSPLFAPVPGQVVQPAQQEARPNVPRVRLPGQQPPG